MKRTIGLFMVVALPAVLLVGCGGDDSADTKSTTTAAADSGKSDSGGTSDNADNSSSGGSAIDEFCTETASIAKDLKQAVSDKDTAALKELQQRATKLQDKMSDLTEEVMKDPSQAKRLTDCAQEVAEAAKG